MLSGSQMANERILIVTKNWFGDVIFEEPFIRALKRKYPESLIICVTASRCKDILLAHPLVDEVITFDDRDRDKSFLKRLQLVSTLRKKKITKAFLLHRSFSRAFILFCAGIKERIGYATKGRGFLLTQAVAEPSEKMHRVDYLLYLLEATGLFIDCDESRVYKSYFSQADAARIDELLREVALKDSSFVCVNPGANWDKKRWPVDSFALCIRYIRERTDLPIVMTGGEVDSERAEEIIAKSGVLNVINVCGKTSIVEVGALLQRAIFVITADSGPMHIAAGVGTTVIALFGPTDVVETGPRGVGKQFVVANTPERCSTPCFNSLCADNECMRLLEPEKVIRIIDEHRLLG